MKLRELMETFKIDRDIANKIVGLIERSINPMSIDSSIHDDNYSDIMDAINILINGYGVEFIQLEFPEDTIEFSYVNLGDTYTPTIVLDDYTFHLTSWGTHYECLEAEYKVTSCGYCSAYIDNADLDQTNWRDTVCSVCGNLIGG